MAWLNKLILAIIVAYKKMKSFIDWMTYWETLDVIRTGSRYELALKFLRFNRFNGLPREVKRTGWGTSMILGPLSLDGSLRNVLGLKILENMVRSCFLFLIFSQKLGDPSFILVFYGHKLTY